MKEEDETMLLLKTRCPNCGRLRWITKSHCPWCGTPFEGPDVSLSRKAHRARGECHSHQSLIIPYQ